MTLSRPSQSPLTGGIAFVTSTSPLRIRPKTSVSDAPATILGGVAYTPAVNDPVVYLRVEKQLFVLGSGA